MPMMKTARHPNRMTAFKCRKEVRRGVPFSYVMGGYVGINVGRRVIGVMCVCDFPLIFCLIALYLRSSSSYLPRARSTEVISGVARKAAITLCRCFVSCT